jgi:putative transposase
VEIRKQAHCAYRCMYHIVIIPRYRFKVLINGVDEYLKVKMDEVRKKHPEIEYIERNIRPDHIHMVVSFPPKYSISKVVQMIKQNTGKALWEKFKFIRERYYGRGGMWSAGYFVSTVGLDEQTLLRYVKYQEKEDLGQAKLALD